MKKKITSFICGILIFTLLAGSGGVYAAEEDFAGSGGVYAVEEDFAEPGDIISAQALSEAEEILSGDADYVEGELLVITENGISAEDLEKDKDISEAVDVSGSLVRLTIEEDASMEEQLAKLIENENIAYAQPNYLYSVDGYEEAAVSVNDPKAAQQFYLDQINISEAWDTVLAGNHEKIRVAVLDTGVNIDHEDIKGVLNEDLSVDVTTDAESYIRLTEDVTGHGTGVTGVICAAAQNGRGIAGVASLGTAENEALDIFGVKVFKYYENENDPAKSGYFCSTSDAIKGIDYALGQNARVINLSFGYQLGAQYTTTDLLFKSVLEKAKAAGAVCVAAAGNNSSSALFGPSDFDSVISVINLNTTGSGYKKAYSSNYGELKDISAPGTRILTCANSVDGYTTMSGTSIASPIVAAVAALMLSVDPSLGLDQVYQYITETAQDIVYTSGTEIAGEGFDIYTAYGLVDAKGAVNAVKENKERMNINESPAMKAVSCASNGLEISWEPVAGAAGYNIYWKKAGTSWQKFASTEDTSYLDRTVRSGREYHYTVSAYDGKGNETVYDSECLPGVFMPAVTLNISMNKSYARLSWSAVTGADGYNIYWRYTGNTEWKKFRTVSKEYYDDYTIKPGMSYDYIIRAYKKSGDVIYENHYDEAYAKTLEVVGDPGLPSVKNVRNGICISWPGTRNAVKYNLYYKRDGIGWTKFAQTTGTEYTDTGLVGGRKYYYSVAAVDKYGNESAYNTTGTVGVWLSGTKVNIKKSAAGVNLSWQAVKGAEGYDLYWRNPGEKSWRYFKSTAAVSYFDGTAKPGRSYEYLVKAYIYHGNTYYHGYWDDSFGASVTMVQTTNISNAKPAADGIYLAWPGASNAVKYNLYYKREGGTWKKFTTVTGTTYTDKTARAGIKYYYSVSAVDKDGAESRYNTNGTACVFLAGTKVDIKKNKTSVTLSWNAVNAADGYYIFWRYPGETKWRYYKAVYKASYEDHSVRPGKSYEYLIAAYKKYGNTYYQGYWDNSLSAAVTMD